MCSSSATITPWARILRIRAAEDLQVFDQELAPTFRCLPTTPHCTEYHEHTGGALDPSHLSDYDPVAVEIQDNDLE
jgi:hypothetical protein